jgi:hypothetical protein
MNKLCGLLLCAAVLAAVGCGTTEKSYMADQPPPLAKADGRTTELDPVKLPGGGGRVTADRIDNTNYHDEIRALESEINAEERALSKVGK